MIIIGKLMTEMLERMVMFLMVMYI